MKSLKTIILSCVLAALIVNCDRDRLPTGVESDAGTGRLVIMLVKDSQNVSTSTQKVDSLSVAVEKSKVEPSAQLSAVSSMLVRVLDASGGEITINPNTFTPQDSFFDATIEVKAQSGLTVLCIGRNSAGAVERFVMATGVDIVAGQTKTISLSESAWTTGFVPRITGISPSPSTNGSYRVSWSSVSGAEGYILQEATNSGFSGASSATYPGNITYVNVSGKAPGTYYYRVQATNSRNVAGAWSTSQSVTVTLAAPVLSDPGTSVLSGVPYTVSWTRVSGATSYTLEKATSNTFTGAATVTLSDTARVYSDTVSSATTYYYQVRANTGTSSSDWSNTVDMAVNPFGVPVVTDPGTSVNSGTSYTVSWGSLSGVSSYTIEEATNSNFSGATSQTVTGTSRQYSHTVSSTITYYYRVRANYSTGSGGWSNTGDMIVNPCTTPALNDPGMSVCSGASYTVSWVIISGATSYTIEEATTNSFTGATSQTVSGASQSYSHSVSLSTTYYYRLKTNCGTGSSGWSNTVDMVVNSAPQAPSLTDPGSSVSSGSSYTVSWGSVSGATSYIIEEATNSSFTGATSQTVSGNSQSFSHSVSSETTYYYRLQANNLCGSGGWSNIVDMHVLPLVAPSISFVTFPDSLVPDESNSQNVVADIMNSNLIDRIEMRAILSNLIFQNGTFLRSGETTVIIPTNSTTPLSGTVRVTGTIPAQQLGTVVEYFLSITDKMNNKFDSDKKFYIVAPRRGKQKLSYAPTNIADLMRLVYLILEAATRTYLDYLGLDVSSIDNNMEISSSPDGQFNSEDLLTVYQMWKQELTGNVRINALSIEEQYVWNINGSLSNNSSLLQDIFLSVRNNSGIVVLAIDINYDPNVLELKTISTVDRAVSMYSSDFPRSDGAQRMVFFCNDGEITPGEGNVIKCQFQVKENVTAGTTTRVYFTTKKNNNILASSDFILNNTPTPSTEIEMLPIPAGTFQMGSNTGWSDEQPVHTVTLSAFQMSKYEITQAQYQAVMGSNPSYFTGDDNRPVEQVSWYDAVTFCNKLSESAGLQPCYNLSTWSCDFTKNGYRLPTEAEWEYACRAGTSTEYYTGNTESDLDRAGWYDYNSGNTTHAVGGKLANAFGLYDMHGNVWEWCNDWYGSYSSENENNPQGPSSGSTRVIRGGSRSYDAYLCRSAFRTDYDPADRYYFSLGFRVVCW
ncbi:MAG TPA: SUMF1/EgtB/PvdO family nonheme iron enzyme [archaeon]|nr:SUMF1/EgtB/PvdO family nonheme iron enzyme [archaeon]